MTETHSSLTWQQLDPITRWPDLVKSQEETHYQSLCQYLEKLSFYPGQDDSCFLSGAHSVSLPSVSAETFKLWTALGTTLPDDQGTRMTGPRHHLCLEP